MSRHNDIHSSIWADDDFLELSADARLVYIWAFSNPAVPLSGIFEAGLRTIAFATGLSTESVSKALDSLCDARFLVRDARTIFVRTRALHVATRNRNTAKNIASHVKTIAPDSPVRAAFLEQYGTTDGRWDGALMVALLAAIDDPPESLRKAVDSLPDASKSLSTASPEAIHSSSGSGSSSSSSRSTSEETTRASASAQLKFGGKPISQTVGADATAILDDFNAQAGTSFKRTTGQGKMTAEFRVIVGAILDHPEITPDIGRAMTARTLADPDPFWKDSSTTKPHPGVVFGENMRGRNLQAVLDETETQRTKPPADWRERNKRRAANKTRAVEQLTERFYGADGKRTPTPEEQTQLQELVDRHIADFNDPIEVPA